MIGKLVIAGKHRSLGMMTAMKVLGLMAVTWGVIFPSLLWMLSRLIN